MKDSFSRVVRLRVGYARGCTADSDVDLLYVRVPGNDLGMSYFALQDDLEKLFGRPVDLTISVSFLVAPAASSRGGLPVTH